MMRECYLCHEFIEDDTLIKCPKCESEILFPVNNKPSEPKTESVVKISIGDEEPQKPSRGFNFKIPELPSFKKQKTSEIKVNPVSISNNPISPDIEKYYTLLNKRLDELDNKISSIPKNNNNNSFEIEKLHKRFNNLETIISNIPVKNTSPTSINTEEILSHLKITQVIMIILIVLVFLVLIVSIF